MKKFSILLLISTLLVSCRIEVKEQTTSKIPFDYVVKFKYRGHSYISFEKSYNQVGLGGVVHDPNCKCKHEQ